MVQWCEAAEDLEIHLLGGLSGTPLCTLSARAWWSVRRLKTEVTNVEGTPVPDQCLVTDGRPLDDAETLGGVFSKEEQRAVSLVRIASERPEPKFGTVPKGLDIGKCDSGGFRVQWAVDGKKLRRNERQAVSPPFELDFGNWADRLELALVLHPSHGSSFQKSKGKGFIDLKCMHKRPQAAARIRVSLSVGNGVTPHTCGPTVHDFDLAAVCHLSQRQREIDFAGAVDPGSMALVVTVEIERLD
uniref:Ubiquitin-like domain-containing protein n=1 Tax=Alexandrium catenella TaxID=2925 RepID=A0A7S1QWT5_ALECA|mmetsp:Transcript_40011/g.108069  ORF Transcript_40011/g.108069 Transcript_40011/m.108069 type:complete len:244 (+) Transcript_40011:53-784(+)